MTANMESDMLHTTPEMWNTGSSLLDLAFKLKQAEYRVYGTLKSDTPVGSGFVTQELSVEEQKFDKLKDAGVKETFKDVGLKEMFRGAPIQLAGSVSFLSSLDYSFDYCFDKVIKDTSLKSIQERYRMFKASFPRFTDGENAGPNENCKSLPTATDSGLTNTTSKENTDADVSLNVSPSQKAISSNPKDSDLPKRHQCDWCSYQTDSRSHLLRHQKAVHREVDDISLSVQCSDLIPLKSESPVSKSRNWNNTPTRRFKCDMCIYSTDCLSHLRRHQGCVHNKMKSYWCYICKKEFSRSEKTKSHFISFHPNIPYDPRKIRKFSPPPRVKPKTISEIWAKVKHKKHASKRSRGSTNDVVEEPCNIEIVVKEKNNGNGQDKLHACPKCNYTSRGLWHLKRHVADVHSTKKEFSCKVCHYAASRQHRLICHMRTHDEIFCMFCDYSNTNIDIFKRHLSLCSAIHRIKTVLRCHVCQVDCPNPEQLKTHINEMHSVILHSCDLCPYYTDVSDEIYAHSRLHVDNELTCKLCNVTFTTDDLFNSHIETKHATRAADKYSCVFCHQEEAELSGLIRHVQVHEPDVFLCGHDACKFKCTVENSRKLHWTYYHENCVPDTIANNSE